MLPKTILFLFIAATAIEAKLHFNHDLVNKKFISDFTQPSRSSFQSLSRGRRSAEDDDGEEIDVTDKENFMAMLKWFTYAAWESDKSNVLGTFLEEFADTHTNVTVVAWQRILGEDGKVAQINTVQMVVPPKPSDAVSIVVSDDDDDDEEDEDRVLPHKEIKKMRENLEPWSLIGTPAFITVEEFNTEGECVGQMFMDCDELLVRAEGWAYYNKTVKDASEKDVEEFISGLPPNEFVPHSILRYDVDGHLIADKSTINPQFLGVVLDADPDVPDEMFNEAAQVIADVWQKNCENDIPKKLAEHYNKKYPDYKWHVLEDPSGVHVSRDIYLTLAYDNNDFLEYSTKSYVVNGKKVTK